MLPAVGLAGHDEGVVRGPVDDAAAGIVGHVGERVVEILAAMPDFFSVARGCVTDPDGPRMRAVQFDEVTLRRVARLGWPANKGDAFSIERPLRRGVRINARRKKLYGFLLRVIDGDETVIAA